MIRKLLIGLAAIIVLIVVALVLVVVLIDPNDYRDQLSAQATEKLGRPVALNGPLKLKVFPRIALEINDVEVGNPPDFPQDEPLAKVGTALASVQLIPLFSGQVLVGDVLLRQTTVNLLTVSEQETNLRGLVAEAETDAAASPVDLSQVQTGAISFEELQINQKNLLTNESQSVRIDRISIGAFQAGRDVDVAVSGNILNGDQILVKDLDIHTVLNVASDLSRISFQDTAVTAQLPSAEAEVDIKTSGAIESLTPITLQLSTLRLEVEMQDGTRAQLDSPLRVVVGDLIQLDISELIAEATLPDGTQAQLSSPVSAQIGETSQIKLSALKAVADLPDGTHVEVSTPVNAKIHANSQELQLSQLQAKVKVPAQNMVLDFNGAVKSKLGTNQRHDLSASTLQLNGQSLQLQGFVELGQKQVMNLKVSGDSLDLRPFIPDEAVAAEPAKTPSEPSAGAGTGDGAGAGTAEPDLTALRDWQMDLALNLKRLQLPDLALDDVIGVLVARDGLITLDPLSAKLFQGQFRGTASIDTRVSPPAVHLQPRLEGVAVQALMQLISPAAPARGDGSMSLDLRFQGLNAEQILSTLDGRGDFSILNGAIIGVDMERLMSEEMTRSNLGNISQAFGGETLFEQMSGSFNAQSGVLQLPAMNMKNVQFGLTGGGQLDLRQQALDYDMQLNLGAQMQAKLPKRLMDATGGVIPLKLSGPLTAPIVTINMESLLKNAVEKEAKKQGKKLLNKLFQKLDEKDKKEAEQDEEGGGG